MKVSQFTGFELYVLVLFLTTVQQHLLGHGQRSVVRRRFDLQQFAHQRVDVDAVERLRQEVPLEVGSKGPEDCFHVHLSVMEAVIAFVDVDDESLVRNKKRKWRNYEMSELVSVSCWFLSSHPALLTSGPIFINLLKLHLD